MEEIIIYDTLGRMTSKQAVTTVNGSPQVTTTFSLPSFDATKVHAMAQAQTSAGLFSSAAQTLTYTGFDKVRTLKQDNDSIRFTYGYDHQRILMEEHVVNNLRTKQYWGNCEYVTESNGNTTSSFWRTFVAGPYGVFAVAESRNIQEPACYILKDNLGSWVTITDANGLVEQQMSFDAWGNRRDPQTWANYTANDAFEEPMFDRGFTGHEHLYSFGLINMNGRMYDPAMSSFLSPDRYVQNPWSAQGFNRYAYCMYNPLRLTDPTGWLAGGGGGHGPGNPLPYVSFEGWTSGYLLNEVTIIDDNPSLSNTKEKIPFNTYYYGGNRLTTPWSENYDGGPSIDPGASTSGDSTSGGGNHGGSPNNTTQNVNVDIGSKLLIPANLYTTIVAKSYYNEFTRQWQDKLGVMRDFDFQGNQYTGGIKSYGKLMSQKYTNAGRILGSAGVFLSAYQCVNATTIDEQLEFGLDAIIGAAGVLFPEEFGIVSTVWFCGGKQATFWYGKNFITPMIKEGINPGLMIYQPFK